MNKRYITVIALMAAMAAARTASAEGETAPAEKAKPRVVSVKQALTQPDEYKDERVLLVGQFMGFNGGCRTVQPVSAADVMIHDKQGLCIYANGPLPANFDPIQKKGYGEMITLSGYVVKQESGQPFFLVPYTEKNKPVQTVNPRALLALRKMRDGDMAILTLESVLKTPDKYIAKPIGMKGLAAPGPEACKTPPPELPDANAETWIMAGADGRCVRVRGPFPLKPDAKTPALATVRGYLEKSGDGFFFQILEEEPPGQEKKPVITIDGAAPAPEPAPGK
jgi:hypothetical protein